MVIIYTKKLTGGLLGGDTGTSGGVEGTGWPLEVMTSAQ